VPTGSKVLKYCLASDSIIPAEKVKDVSFISDNSSIRKM
jgi:hypothetical protein